ncbi:MAG: ABC transporter ATP-binding protein [Thermoplasmatota archaeon]
MTSPLIFAKNLSKWYGEVIGLNSFNLEVNSGITGIVGPNGAGKSTFFKLITGMIRANSGEIYVMDEDPWNNTRILQDIGFCPDYDNLPDDSTGFEFLSLSGRLHGMKNEELVERIYEVSEIVGMTKALNRKIGGYSKGMRQRIKLAGSILHEPDVLLLDEPLSGADPEARKSLIEVIKALHSEKNHDIVVSSHVLFEIERMTKNVALIYKGRAIASGDISEIRALIDEHPHNVVIKGDDITELGKRLLDKSYTISVRFEGSREHMNIEVSKPEEFFSDISKLVTDTRCEITELYSLDDNLEAVFKYLIGG